MGNRNIIKKRPFSGPTEFLSETDKGPNSEKLKYFLPNKYFLAVQQTSVSEGHATEDVSVLHSQAVDEKPLQPWLIIEQIGSVKSAHCTCMAGLGEACSHIWSTSVLCRAPYSSNLTKAIQVTGDTYEEVGNLYGEQPKNDLEPFSDILHEYKGILASWPEIVQIQKIAEKLQTALNLYDT